ncbi:MAG: oxidoreductase [Pedosphaera sp.]|nr:oxidoreductase [Pedosphaera sp.]
MDLNLYPPLPRRKNFRIGILGSGFIVNECHLVAYRKAGFNPVSIASRNFARAMETAARHGIASVHESYAKLLDDPSIEVLDIAVPPNALLELIQQACERGTVKGILAQKPLGINYAEAVEAVRLCQTAGITLAVNQNMRYDHSVRAAKTLLTNGTIGEPVIATVEMRGIPHWQPWQAELGWATLRIMSIHHLDTFRYWFGQPDRVYCSTRPDPRTKFPHTDGICTYILEYANGLRCIAIDDTWTGPAKEGCPSDISIKWRIEGLNGLAIGSIGWCHDPCTTPSTIQYAAKGDPGFQAPVWPESWFPDAFSGTMGELLCALEERRQPVISGEDNLKTMAMVEAAYVSAGSHAAVSPAHIAREYHEAEQELLGKTPALKWPKFLFAFKQGPDGTVLSNFTPMAQRALGLAAKEARRLGHNFVGTEHLLLGLMALGQGVAIAVLLKLGLSLEAVRLEIEQHVGTGPEGKLTTPIPYTPRLKRVLVLAAKEARNLEHTAIGTEHLLLGLMAEGDGLAPRVLKKFGVTLEQARELVLTELKPSH